MLSGRSSRGVVSVRRTSRPSSPPTGSGESTPPDSIPDGVPTPWWVLEAVGTWSRGPSSPSVSVGGIERHPTLPRSSLPELRQVEVRRRPSFLSPSGSRVQSGRDPQ